MLDDHFADSGDGQPDPKRPAIPDPFLDSYDTSRIKLNDETLDRLLGLAVVISNFKTK